MDVRRVPGMCALGWVLAAAAPAHAQPDEAAPSPAGAIEAAAVDHGSGQGDGNSRGPGAGDGRGKTLRGEVPPLEVAEDEPPAAPDPFSFRAGAFTLRPRLEYRVRFYHQEGRDFDRGGVANFFRHRARVGLEGFFDEWVGVRVAVQDVRTWGIEQDPRNEVAPSFDLAEGYLELRPADHLSLRLGKQFLNVADGQLIGRAPFSEGERRFDAIRFAYEDGGSILELAYAYTRFVPGLGGLGDVDPDRENEGSHVGFVHVANQAHEALGGRAIAVFEGSTIDDAVRGTLGVQLEGASSGPVKIGYEAHGYYQLSDRALRGDSLERGVFHGFLVRGGLDATLVDNDFEPFLEAHAVVTSGSSGDDLRTFVRPFPNAHWPHGEMDLITNYALHTQLRGLRDLGGAIGWRPLGIETKVTAYVFDTVFEDSGPPRGQSASTHIGSEVDFSASYRLHDYVRLRGLYAFFVPGDATTIPSATGSDLEQFAYVTAHAKF